MSRLKRVMTIVFALFIQLSAYALDNQLHHEIQAVVSEAQEQYQIPGIQVSLRFSDENDPIGFVAGVAEIASGEPLNSTHLMQIGSITKSFIAALILMLEAESEAGHLGFDFNLEQTLGEWLPEYPDWRQVKIRQLLNMTSGIYNYTDNRQLAELTIEDKDKIWQEDDLIQLAYTQSPNASFKPGKGYEYSNTNYVLAGMIIEKVTGKSLDVVINERILQKYPEIFTRTFYHPKKNADEYFHLMAHGYVQNEVALPELFGQDVTSINVSWANAAGAIISNANNLSGWIGLLMNGNVLPEKQMHELKTTVCMMDACNIGEVLVDNESFAGYGLGVIGAYDPILGMVWTHAGSTIGYQALFLWIPSMKLTLTILTNHIAPALPSGFDEKSLIALAILKLLNADLEPYHRPIP